MKRSRMVLMLALAVAGLWLAGTGCKSGGSKSADSEHPQEHPQNSEHPEHPKK